MENGAVFQKSAWKSIFSLCVPALISIVVMMLYNMADMYFVGWLGDYAQVASVSLAGPVFSVLMGVSTMIGNGGCTRIAQALGRKDLDQVRRDCALCVWASLASGAVFAAATVLGNAIALAYYLIYQAKSSGRCIIKLRPRYAGDMRELGSILALGLPNAISSVLSGFAGTFSNRMLTGYGIQAVAAMAAAGKAAMVVTMVQMGVCMGVQPLLAFCCGGRDWPRLREVTRKVLGLTAGIGAAMTLAIWLGRGPIIGLFIQDEAVAALGRHLSTYMILMGPFIGVYYFCTNFLQASGSAAWACAASALRQGLLLIPLLYMMNALLRLEGLALAHVLSDGASILITAALALWCYQKLLKSGQKKRTVKRKSGYARKRGRVYHRLTKTTGGAV